MTKQRIAFFLAAVLAASSLASCGDTTPSGDETTTAPSDDTTTVADTPAYNYPKYEGTVRVLNIDDCYNMHARIDTKETNGDTLNDTQYNAVRYFEEQTGVIWEETNIEVKWDTMHKEIGVMVQADEDLYDITYQSYYRFYASNSREGYFVNILDYDEAQLDKPWWITDFNKDMTVNGSLYTALGYSHLCTADAIGVLNFNQSMMEDLGLDLPYQSVKDGTWTVDEMLTYCKAAARLNGDDKFEWKDDGNCVWGLIVPNSDNGWYDYFGQPLVSNENGKLVLNGQSDRFQLACEASARILGATADGSVYQAHNLGDNVAGSYINAFEVERGLFGKSEVCKANRMRNFDFTFGILPYPKLDEQQDRYYQPISYPACGVAVPVTCKTPERSFALGDAINYVFYEKVWPTFREVTLEQKNLRNEESIEMLDIVLNSIFPLLANVYDIGTKYFNDVGVKLREGDATVASVLAAYKESIESQLEELNN